MAMAMQQKLLPTSSLHLGLTSCTLLLSSPPSLFPDRCPSSLGLRIRPLTSAPQLLAFHRRSTQGNSWRVRRLNILCVMAESDTKPDSMVVSITGATGFIGTRLVQRLVADGLKVRVLTRSTSVARSLYPSKQYPNVEIIAERDWTRFIQGSTAVVNLAGTPISTRWSPQIKEDIKKSRVRTTAKVVEAINGAPMESRPSVFVSATAVGFYGSSETQTFDESSPSGKDYLAEVCREWESTAQKVDGNVRLVLVRIGIVLDKDGGALAKMIPLFQIFAGGPIGSGKQWFSWVHRDDLVSLIIEALSNPSYQGVINGTAPNPVRLTEMCDRLGTVLNRPSWLPVPDFAVKALLGEGACVVLDGQRVVPKKALQLGFMFKYRYITDALKAIISL